MMFSTLQAQFDNVVKLAHSGEDKGRVAIAALRYIERLMEDEHLPTDRKIDRIVGVCRHVSDGDIARELAEGDIGKLWAHVKDCKCCRDTRIACESAFRRGYLHGWDKATDALCEGAEIEDLILFQNEYLMPWRDHDRGTTEPPPSFHGAP